MNPVASAALGAILRWVLALAAGFFVEHGIWTSQDASTYVAAASLGLLSLGLSLWNKYRGRIKFLTALTMAPGATEDEVKAHIASGAPTPSLATPADVVPTMPKP